MTPRSRRPIPHERLDLAGALLLDRLPDEYLATARQNDGPTIGSVLRAVVSKPEHLRAHGYVIGPGRCDERITVEGVLFRSDGAFRPCPIYGPPLDDCDCERLYDQLRSQLGVDDAVVRPHELDHWLGYDWREGRYHPERWYRAWWD